MNEYKKENFKNKYLFLENTLIKNKICKKALTNCHKLYTIADSE